LSYYRYNSTSSAAREDTKDNKYNLDCPFHFPCGMMEVGVGKQKAKNHLTIPE